MRLLFDFVDRLCTGLLFWFFFYWSMRVFGLWTPVGSCRYFEPATELGKGVWYCIFTW